jgi:hypothetical protein
MEGGTPRERGLLGPRSLGMLLTGNDKTSLTTKGRHHDTYGYHPCVEG